MITHLPVQQRRGGSRDNDLRRAQTEHGLRCLLNQHKACQEENALAPVTIRIRVEVHRIAAPIVDVCNGTDQVLAVSGGDNIPRPSSAEVQECR